MTFPPGPPPADPPADLLAQAQRLRAAGDPDAAIAFYEAALAQDPDQPRALLALGALHVARFRPSRAEPLLRRCCALVPADAPAHHAWGLSLLMLAREAEALAPLRRGHALDPSNTLCGVHLADAAQALGQAEDCLALFDAERRRHPASAAALTALAATLAHLGRRGEAIDALEAATLLDPDDAVAAAMFADLLARTTRQTDAEAALRRALALDPANDDATMALSVVLMRLHRHAEAVELLRGLQQRDAAPLGPLCNLATALTSLGRQHEAVDAAREAIRLAPSHPAPRRALCNALPYLPGIGGADLLAAARAASATLPRAAPPPLCNLRLPERRLRVGLLSGTLRAHPVGWFTIAAFEHLDPGSFELLCLSPHLPEDHIGRRFAAIAAQWVDTGAHDDAQLAAHLRSLQLDIVIDLGGYGDFGRLSALAHRAAPVQIKWVGMQNHSTGIDEIDGFISDQWETPAHLAQHYSERLMLMPHGYVCYDPPSDAPPVAALPALQRGHFTFGCFNNLAKINPVVLDTWSCILRAVPDARLILKTHQFNNAETSADLHAHFAARGIDPSRVTLRGSSPHRELLRQYNDVDLILDPFPYSGGLTTCEALWMGVPTLTMPGETFASRHSASHLSNVGLQDWIVADPAAYQASAVAATRNLASLATLRAGLRERVRASKLCDAPHFAAAFGAILRNAWRDWCTHGQTPAVSRLREPAHV